eukprot:scaffold11130_cov42-Prasinocladus_malaysianus.AAC.1
MAPSSNAFSAPVSPDTFSPVDNPTTDFGGKLMFDELSPRTPLDFPTIVSPINRAKSWAPTSNHSGYSLFPEDMYPERNLPAGLFDGL